MLTVYRRHVKTCPHRSRQNKRCHCPLWVQGTLGGRTVRHSLDLRSWQAAVDRVRVLEEQGTLETVEPITIREAVRLFLDDANSRNLSPDTIGKYRVLLEKQLLAWSKDLGFTYLLELDIHHLRNFRATLKDGAISSLKKLERLRGFFRFCLDSKWIQDNPASKIKMPRVDDIPTLPFSEEEVSAILTACARYPTQNAFGYDNRARVRAFILLLLHTGLRIRDVACLESQRIVKGRLMLYTQKTKVPVFLPLHPAVMDALSGLPATGGRFFWSGNGNPKSCVADWQRSLRRLFKIAGIQNGHAHRFRDTFACRLLQNGVPLSEVSKLLGHRSERITERHYAPWIQSRQDRLEDLVRQSWTQGSGDKPAT